MTTFCVRCWAAAGYELPPKRLPVAHFVIGGRSLCPEHAQPEPPPEQRATNGE